MLRQNPNHGNPLGLKESSNQGVELGWLHGIEIETLKLEPFRIPSKREEKAFKAWLNLFRRNGRAPSLLPHPLLCSGLALQSYK